MNTVAAHELFVDTKTQACMVEASALVSAYLELGLNPLQVDPLLQ